MRRFAVAILAVALVIQVVPLQCLGDQLPAPKIESVFPGVTRIIYADETFVFTTTVRLSATFEYLPTNEIRIKIKTNVPIHQSMAMAPAPAVRIYWEEGDEILFDGALPDGEWIGIVQTEGGFTDK
jgi:hypothetical protein